MINSKVVLIVVTVIATVVRIVLELNQGTDVWMQLLITYLLYGLIAAQLTLLASDCGQSRNDSTLPAVLFFLLMVGLYQEKASIKGAVVSILLLQTCHSLMATYRHFRPMMRIFHTFILLGIASFLLPVVNLLIPFYWLIAGRCKSLQARSFTASVLGWLFPFFFMGGVMYLIDRMDWLQPYLQQIVAVDDYPLPLNMVGMIFMLILQIGSVFYVLQGNYRRKHRTRIYVGLIAIASFLAPCSWLIPFPNNVCLIPFYAACISLLAAYWVLPLLAPSKRRSSSYIRL